MEYYNVNRQLNEKSMPINVALLKYGYTNFSLTILEFCNKDSLMSREKHFFEVHSPEYNILNTAGSLFRGYGWKHSEATIDNMRIAACKTFKSPEFLTKLSKGQSSGIKVEVTDLVTNITTTYHAIRASARALDIDKRYIEHFIYLGQDKPVLGRYTFKLNNSVDESTNLIIASTDKTVEARRFKKLLWKWRLLMSTLKRLQYTLLLVLLLTALSLIKSVVRTTLLIITVRYILTRG